ncbi:MAG: cob(I)yrinic acid a,c-diamide adenosyltransferase [Lachnospiraceae bacterium]|uniref:cob(I)yrinic acid a,c-diamide adenosyltransferase n=1 Tax=Candidatus Merdisoma sp. JLR.KK011 TaxID=3114299 RepID=UPI0029DB2B0E|nr:cob(I)yrinic acid a,c-diamide adenosyltransferase [Lachnospiraceae bacterium]MCI9252822.1 cob(I)yrinic acid a,c-diamide adenosyltransferase [Lachnospiraceae bacterium]MCI9383505.1 cob(I)yrinic acid a,c-diamide adenosyltransferase [Lachnospiraceae bacterium]MCI9480496.1 cob(I)yrinic acid a,c-diamide adenosyltransferase [Lachnospiraceae bacterium]MCI9624874.1 cob(I)yrinic acid a,c-diamide adenosyltransferase [Lachnospiraceae bacterium]
MAQSCIHIYCGDGKGKTTAAMGLALRAAGSGRKVLVAQFLKDGSSSELKILRELPGVKVLTCPRQFGFYWNMTEEQKAEAECSYEELFEKAAGAAVEEDIFLLVMDELIAAYNHGLLDRERVLAFLREKPEGLEVVLTGRDPDPELVKLADYVSEIQKKKHPFDKGIPAREGIEL